MLIKVTVNALTLDPYNNSPIIILKEENGDKSLPIWIGLLEATAIASELEDIKFPRPMTHDLMRNIIDTLGGVVDQIEICDLKDNTFFALIHVIAQNKKLQIDARPSDAIALGLRLKAPIFVDEVVFKKSSQIDMRGTEALKDSESKKWTDILESLNPEDFGKYKM